MTVGTSKLAAEETRHEDRREWRFINAVVTEIRFDAGGFRFHAWTLEADLMVRLSTTIRLTLPTGTVTLEPERATTLEPLLSLLGLSLTSATVLKTGSLRLAFTGDVQIAIDPHPLYEAWEAEGSGAAEHFGYLCGPAGGSPWG